MRTATEKFNDWRRRELQRLLDEDKAFLFGRPLIVPSLPAPRWWQPRKYWPDLWHWEEYEYGPHEDRNRPNPQWVDADSFRPKSFPAAPDDNSAMNATIKTDHRAKIFAICKQRADAANACVNAMAPLHEAWKSIRADCHGARAILDDPTALQIRFEPCGGPAFIWRARFDSVENAVVYSMVQGAEQTFFLTAAAMLDAFYASLADYGGLTIFS